MPDRPSKRAPKLPRGELPGGEVPKGELTRPELDKVTGGGEIKTGQAPSTSVGSDSGISTSRQTINDSFGSKIVGGAG